MEEDVGDSSDWSDIDQNTILRALLKVVEIRELPKWRLVNKFCNSVATVQMEHGGVCAKIQDDDGMARFLSTMTSHPHPFPFRSYSLSLGSITTVNIQQFVQMVSGAVDEFKFCDFLPEFDPYEILFFPEEVSNGFRENEIQTKILTLLSSVPSLRELYLNADADIPLNGEELSLLPSSFPVLRKVTVDYVCVFAEAEHDLLSVLIGRSPQLDSLGIKIWDGPNRDFNSKIPSFLYDLPRTQPPRLDLQTEMTVDDTEMIGKLVENGFNRLTHFILCFMADDMDELFWTNVQSLLTLQSQTLESLVVQSFNQRSSFQIVLPSLQKLKTLVLSILVKEEPCPIAQLTQDQFPALEELNLYGPHSVDYRFLDGIVMSSLRKLAVWDYLDSAQGETFHLNFPHLTSLEVELKSSDLPFLEFAFTHLTGIMNLELGSSLQRSGVGIGAELWNLYTGCQGQMTKAQLLNNGCTSNKGEDWKPLLVSCNPTGSVRSHRIYACPSLANFSFLKDLKVWTRTTLEIEALVFMSRPGGLPILDKLILGYRPSGNWEDDDPLDSEEDTPNPEWTPASAVDFPNDLLPSEQSQVSSTSTEGREEYAEVVLTQVAEILEESEEADDDADDENGDDDDDESEELRVTLGFQPQLVFPHRVTVAESGIDHDYISILENYHKNVILLMS